MRETQQNAQLPLWGDRHKRLTVVEICAGAGGQALGLEMAGFEHELAVELDPDACATLRRNRPAWGVAEGDVASSRVWEPGAYAGVDLLAGGVPCPPFSIAGKQLGADDERDLFAWAVELCGTIRPRALLLENVRGLSLPRFSGYRQHVLDRLSALGYAGDWRVLHASDFGVPQLRPRFVLVAMKPDDFQYFTWPDPQGEPPTVGAAIGDLMASGGWPGAVAWARGAASIAPTIVGGSKKHGDADLGPTRAKRAWAKLGVNGLSVADAPPGKNDPESLTPRLTCEMVARIQGWDTTCPWVFVGGKTARYRQIGNAFPPPVAHAIGERIHAALRHEGSPRELVEQGAISHDPIYTVLRENGGFLTMDQILRRVGDLDAASFDRHVSHLGRDFTIHIETRPSGRAYRLGAFKAFTGERGTPQS